MRLYGKICLRLALGALLLGLLCSGAGCPGVRDDTPEELVDARRAMIQRDFLEAEKFFERYLKRNPEGGERWEVWNSLVELAMSVRNDRKATIELLEAMRIEYAGVPAKTREISVRLAELYRLARRYDRAVYLWAAVAEDPGAGNVERARAYRNLAHVYLRRLEFELAKESLGQCLDLELPGVVQAECLYDLAQTHLGMDDADSAIAGLRAVLKLENIAESTRTLTVFMLADALDQKGLDDEAARLFSGIRESYPNRKVVERRLEFLEKKQKTVPPKGNGHK